MQAIRKDAWTSEEDDIIVALHRQLGNRWAEIAKQLKEKGFWRTDKYVVS
jgi:hypothetical protein